MNKRIVTAFTVSLLLALGLSVYMRVQSLEHPPTPTITPTAISTPTPTPTPTTTSIPTPIAIAIAIATPHTMANYQTVLDILGPTGVILPLVDTSTGGFGPTFNTVGSLLTTFTWSESPQFFDTPPSIQGTMPVVTFNGIDEEAHASDNNYWSIDDSSGEAFSIAIWVNRVPGDPVFILNKRGEFHLVLNSNRLQLEFRDASESALCSRMTESTIAAGVWAWKFLTVTYDGRGGATYDGRGGATAADGIRIYVDGQLVPATTIGCSTYINMDNLTNQFVLGEHAGRTARHNKGKIAGGPAGPSFTHRVLTATEVIELHSLGLDALGLSAPN